MIYNTTWFNKDDVAAINECVGEPYSVWQRLKMGGNGCERMKVVAVSSAFENCLNAKHYVTMGSMELRPKGVLIYIKPDIYEWTWPVPYFRLSVYKTNLLSLHAEGQFVKFQAPLRTHHAFVRKLMTARSQFFPDSLTTAQ